MRLAPGQRVAGRVVRAVGHDGLMAETNESVPTEEWPQGVRTQLERVQATLSGLLGGLDGELDRGAVTAAALEVPATAQTEISLVAHAAACTRQVRRCCCAWTNPSTSWG